MTQFFSSAPFGVTLLAMAASFAPAASAASLSPNAQAWEQVLDTRLSDMGTDGVIRFDYAGFASSDADRAALDAYIQELSDTAEPEDDAQAAAYWANLYNAVTIDVVADNYPVESIRDIKSGLFKPGPWDKDLVTVQGKTLTLNNIEHDILRKRYASPHVHYMVNCASIGCPNLQPKLWQGETLEADRTRAAREFINSPRGVMTKGDKLVVSSIYEWFQVDFGGSKSAVVDHIREFADAPLAAKLEGRTRFTSHDYNWDLNE